MKIGNMDRDTVLHFCSEAELVLWCVRDGGSWVYRKQSGKLKTGFLQLIFSTVNPSHSKQNYSHFFHSSENVKKNISFSLVFSITQHKCDICFSPRLRTLSLSLSHTHKKKKKKGKWKATFFETSSFYIIRNKIGITFSARMVSSILMYVKKSEISNSQTKLVTRFLHEQFRKWRWFDDTEEKITFQMPSLIFQGFLLCISVLHTHTHTHTYTPQIISFCPVIL